MTTSASTRPDQGSDRALVPWEVEAGPNLGELTAFQLEPGLGLDEDEEAMRAAGWDESEARQCGLLSTPRPPAPDRDREWYGPTDDWRGS